MSCGYVVDWPHVAQVRFRPPKRPHSEKKTCHSETPLSWIKKMRTFKKNRSFIFYLLLVQKVVSRVQKRCFWVCCTGCEVADLKQRQKTFKMNHRNKIQSLVLPTDDPRDAPDCITEYGPVPVNFYICPKSANFSKFGVSIEHKLHFVTVVLLKPPKEMPASKYGQQRKNSEILPKINRSRKWNCFGEAPQVFSPRSKGLPSSMAFCTLGPFWLQNGADPPISTCIEEKLARFFEVRVFHQTQVG